MKKEDFAARIISARCIVHCPPESCVVYVDLRSVFENGNTPSCPRFRSVFVEYKIGIRGSSRFTTTVFDSLILQSEILRG